MIGVEGEKDVHISTMSLSVSGGSFVSMVGTQTLTLSTLSFTGVTSNNVTLSVIIATGGSLILSGVKLPSQWIQFLS